MLNFSTRRCVDVHVLLKAALQSRCMTELQSADRSKHHSWLINYLHGSCNTLSPGRRELNMLACRAETRASA